MSAKTKTIISWTLRIIAAGLLLQTLFFKFSAAPESVYIFSKLGVEPWGRIGTGVMELIAAVLLLIPRSFLLGALLAAGIMGGALLSHIFVLGIVIMDDGGQLFIYGLIVLACCVSLLGMNLKTIMNFLPARFHRGQTPEVSKN